MSHAELKLCTTRNLNDKLKAPNRVGSMRLLGDNSKTPMKKTIIVQWVKEEWGYGKAMRVVESDHPRVTVGSRFDFGFFNIATDEGYKIVSLPMSPNAASERRADGNRESKD